MGFEGRCSGDASVVRQWCVLPLHACVLIFFHRALGAFFFCFVSLNWLPTSAFFAWPRPYSFSF